MSTSERSSLPNGHCDDCRIRDRSLCVADRDEDDLGRASHVRTFAADRTVMSEFGPSEMVGHVVAGVMRVVKTLPDGRQQIVGLVYPGEFFGRPYSDLTEFAYEAATDIEVCVIERRQFEAILERSPDLKHELLTRTLADLAFVRERLLLLGCQTTLERLATYLLAVLERREQLLAGLAVTRHMRVAASAINRRDLASFLSTTIETISRHVTYLARLGVIRIIDSSHFEVLDYDRLLAISGVAREDLRIFRRATPRPGRPTTSPLVRARGTASAIRPSAAGRVEAVL